MFRIVTITILLGIIYHQSTINIKLKEQLSPPLTETDIRVKWVKFDKFDDVRSYCVDKLNVPEDEGSVIHACTIFDLINHTCTIYALEPIANDQFGDRMTVLGHELYHCFEGYYHP